MTAPDCEDTAGESQLDTLGAEARNEIALPAPPFGLDRPELAASGTERIHVYSAGGALDRATCMDWLPWMVPVEARGSTTSDTTVFECRLSGRERAWLRFARDHDGSLWLEFVTMVLPATLALPTPELSWECAAIEEALLPASVTADSGTYTTLCMEKPSQTGAPGDGREIWILLPDNETTRALEPGERCWTYGRYLEGQSHKPSIPLTCKMELGGRP